MPTYIATGSYTTEGVAGLLKTGGTQRSQQIGAVAEGLGGHLIGMYFGMAQNDVFILFELPDNITAGALSKAVNAAGTGHCNIEPILTPAELDEALKIDTKFVAPGS